MYVQSIIGHTETVTLRYSLEGERGERGRTRDRRVGSFSTRLGKENEKNYSDIITPLLFLGLSFITPFNYFRRTLTVCKE